MSKKALPKKILVIKDCTFILPDDFEGSVDDAFDELLKYRCDNLKNGRYLDDNSLFSSFDVLLHGDDREKCCGHYALYELIDGTNYEIRSYTKNENKKPKK